MKTYPITVSRTLDPSNKSLVTIVGLHDHQLADADINLIQDLQDQKRQRLLADQVTSGCLTYSPMQFDPNTAYTFSIPSFDVLFNGEVVTVTGHKSADLTMNKVVIPEAASWSPGQEGDDARIYVVFLEMWYQALDPSTGTGYCIDPNDDTRRFFYPYGCVNPDANYINSTDAMADDTIDIFNGGLYTTQRAQIQWRLNVQRVALSYDFSKYQFGLDPGVNASETVYAQGSSTAPVIDYPFANMGTINGDTGIWRAGAPEDESLGTMDGYSYAMPIAVVFQRNRGAFTLDLKNPFGCANPNRMPSGVLLTRDSGRFDHKFADSVWPEDVVDTRQVVSLDGFESDDLISKGFVDLVSGTTSQKLSRGESPGNKNSALGSALNYTIAVSDTALPNCDTLGQFDGVQDVDGSWHGFQNGFSADQRTFYTTKKITIGQKATGDPNSRWTKDDSFVVSLPATSPATIDNVNVQCLVEGSWGRVPTLLLQGQISVTYDSSRKNATVKFLYDLQNTPYNPRQNPLYVTIGATYPAGGSMNLKKIPNRVYGGLLKDAAIGRYLPVYGVSEYDISAEQVPLTANGLVSYNNGFSDVVFGTRASLLIPGSMGISLGGSSTYFLWPCANVDKDLNGLYVISCQHADTKVPAAISARSIVPADSATGTPAQMGFIVNEVIDPDDSLLVQVLCSNTVQLVYNAPVKGVTAIEETVLVGKSYGDGFSMDSNRVEVLSVGMDYSVTPSQNVVVLAATDCMFKGVSGDDLLPIIWVKDQTKSYTAVNIDSITINNGLATIRVPNSVNLDQQQFFMVASIFPALRPDSTLLLSTLYTPYQGEGVPGRDYEVIKVDENALVTTNGTGQAPLVGLQDVFPLNRELPIVTTLPSQVSWNDAELMNQAVASFFDSNYDAKQFNNVEHTFEVPVKTNDYIQPISGGKRKYIRFPEEAMGRGHAKTVPHIGYAVRPLTQRSVLSDTLASTVAPITLYVDNSRGNDLHDGLTVDTPVKNPLTAFSKLPPALRHPCTIYLAPTGKPYSLGTTQLQTIVLGDGDIRSIKYYALANLAYTIQGAGRLVISTLAGSSESVVIDGSDYVSDGTPASAFFVENTRVMFNNLTFSGFIGASVKGLDADIEFINCDFANNLIAGSFEQGCLVTVNGGSLSLGNAAQGMLLSSSDILMSGMDWAVESGAKASAFVVALDSNVELQKHDKTMETNVQAGTLTVLAQTASNVTCDASFTSGGKAALYMNSSLSRSVEQTPFDGGITSDVSSSVVTSLS